MEAMTEKHATELKFLKERHEKGFWALCPDGCHFIYLLILAAQHALQDLCSPTRHQTQACGSMES